MKKIVKTIFVRRCDGCPNWYCHMEDGNICREMSKTIQNMNNIPSWCPLDDA